jgi:hypothetical protein
VRVVSIGIHGFAFGMAGAPGSTIAVVFLPHAMITLSRSAAARSLRPL